MYFWLGWEQHAKHLKQASSLKWLWEGYHVSAGNFCDCYVSAGNFCDYNVSAGKFCDYHISEGNLCDCHMSAGNFCDYHVFAGKFCDYHMSEVTSVHVCEMLVECDLLQIIVIRDWEDHY